MELIPVSALNGDNVVDPSSAMTWYAGPTLLAYLETVPLATREIDGPLRFPVQLVVRPDASFRGFAGRVERGELRPGMTVRALPSGRVTRVRSLVTFDGELRSAHAPQAVTVELEDEIDLSRGEMLVADEQAAPSASTRVRAMVVWMHEQPLTVGANTLLKHTTRTVRATVRRMLYRVDVNTAEHMETSELAMNDIAELELETNLPLFFDPYAENRATGSFILIDPLSNATLGAGMLLPAFNETAARAEAQRVPVFVYAPGEMETLLEAKEKLKAQGISAVLVDDALIPEISLAGAVRALQLAGVVALSSNADLTPETLAALRQLAPDGFLGGDELKAYLREAK